jgi:hypothetical protein
VFDAKPKGDEASGQDAPQVDAEPPAPDAKPKGEEASGQDSAAPAEERPRGKSRKEG